MMVIIIIYDIEILGEHSLHKMDYMMINVIIYNVEILGDHNLHKIDYVMMNVIIYNVELLGEYNLHKMDILKRKEVVQNHQQMVITMNIFKPYLVIQYFVHFGIFRMPETIKKLSVIHRRSVGTYGAGSTPATPEAWNGGKGQK